MMLQVIILCCVLQSIAGAKISNHNIESLSISPRIAGGRDAAEGQAPYQCSLQEKPDGHYCGCAIISAEWIVTAAHCLEDKMPRDIQIVAGTNQWKTGGTHYYAKKVIIHESYNNPRGAYDIGLIRVQTPIEFSEKVQPIKLSAKEVGSGENLQVTGWGKPQINGSIPDNLQVLNVTSISNEECKKLTTVHESNLCTLSQRGRGICGSDSGGPLVNYLVNAHELVGIVNWRSTIVCARGEPDGYARISYLYDWIEKNVQSQ